MKSGRCLKLCVIAVAAVLFVTVQGKKKCPSDFSCDPSLLCSPPLCKNGTVLASGFEFCHCCPVCVKYLTVEGENCAKEDGLSYHLKCREPMTCFNDVCVKEDTTQNKS